MQIATLTGATIGLLCVCTARCFAALWGKNETATFKSFTLLLPGLPALTALLWLAGLTLHSAAPLLGSYDNLEFSCWILISSSSIKTIDKMVSHSSRRWT